MSGLISKHRSDSAITVESDDTLLTVSKGEIFYLKEYLGTYTFIDSDDDSLPISQSDFDDLISKHVELVVVDAPSIYNFLQKQTGYNVKPKLLANIATGNTNDIKTCKATRVILDFLGDELYDASCDAGLLIVMLSYLAGNYCGRTDGPKCLDLITKYGNPTKVEEPKVSKSKKTKPPIETEYQKVDGYMRLKDGTDFDFNVVDIQKFYNAYDPDNLVDTLKDVGIRTEDAVIRLIGKKNHKELTTPHQVNKYLKKVCG